MNEWIDSSDANDTAVSVWTPWGEQKVVRADKRAHMRRAQARSRRGDEGIAPPSLSESAFSEARG